MSGMLHSPGTQRSLSRFKNLAGLFLVVVPCRVTLAVLPVQGRGPWDVLAPSALFPAPNKDLLEDAAFWEGVFQHPPCRTPCQIPSRQELRGTAPVPGAQGSSPCNVNLLLHIQGCPWKSCRLRRLVCQAQDKLFSSTLPEQMPGRL